MTRVGVLPLASFRSWVSCADVQALPLLAGVFGTTRPFSEIQGRPGCLLGRPRAIALEPTTDRTDYQDS